MSDNPKDIIDEYFKSIAKCNSMSCRKVIFEPATKSEWFFEEGKWCYFKFLCDDKDYRLVSTVEKTFDDSCYLKDMSYEIRMLFGYIHLRNVVTIEKDVFSAYVLKYEKAKESNPQLTLEKFNYDLRVKEEEELEKTDKVANKILTGCLAAIILTIIVFGIFVLSMFFGPKAEAKSKYSNEFIQNFIICKNFSESKYNVAYNANSTYEIKGFAPDGSGKCIYKETNRWQRGANETTCMFDSKQLQEFYAAMLNPDVKGSVMVKGMPVVGQNEEVTFLKYFNNQKVCQTKAVQ